MIGAHLKSKKERERERKFIYSPDMFQNLFDFHKGKKMMTELKFLVEVPNLRHSCKPSIYQL